MGARQNLNIAAAVGFAVSLVGCYPAQVAGPPTGPVGQPLPVTYYFGVVLGSSASGQGQVASTVGSDVAELRPGEVQLAAATLTTPRTTAPATHRQGGGHGGGGLSPEDREQLFEAGVAGGQLIGAAISAATTPQIVAPPVLEYTVVLDNGPTIDLAQYWYPNEFILQANDRAAVRLVNGGAARVVPEGSIPPYLR